jgi:hypothetical protein
MNITHKISKYFWTIPVLTIVVYSATVLFQFGYNSYFNVPSTVIDSSLAFNVIFSFYFLKLVGLLAFKLWWLWIIAAIIAYAVFAVFNLSSWLKIIPIVGIIVFLCFCPSIGDYLAKHTEYFYIVSDNCETIDPTKYVILNFYDDKAVLLSIEDNTEKVGAKKLTGSFLIKNVSDLGCDIKLKKIGVIER